jgi:hypothetical protein
LTGILDVTSFAMNAVLGIDLEIRLAITAFDDFINPSWAIQSCWLSIKG